MAELNDARDWDVFITETLPKFTEACPDVGGFEPLREAADGHWRRAHEKARAANRDVRTGRFQIGLALWVEQKAWRGSASADAARSLSQPARGFARESLAALHRRVLKKGRRFKDLSQQERHKLRIALKKLRYAADFLAPLGKGRKHVRAYAEALSRLQDELGVANDLSVVERLIQRIAQDRIPSPARFAAGALLGWTIGHLPRNDDGIVAAWKAFRKLDVHSR
jgi:CHAD domain-containing protein